MSNETSKLTEARELPVIVVSTESEVHKAAIRIDPKGGDMYQGFLRGQMYSSDIIASQQSQITRLKAELEEVKEKWENQRITIQFYQDDLKAIRDIINS